MFKLTFEEGKGGCYGVTVNDYVPDELQDRNQMIDEMEENGTSVEKIRAQLKAIKAGKYTFCFTITDGEGYYYSEDAGAEIKLTALQARGLLYVPDRVKLFNGIRFTEDVDDEFLCGAAEEQEICKDENPYKFRGECSGLDEYLNAWKTLLTKILAGEIQESELDEWLRYFDELNDYKMDIKDWHEDYLDSLNEEEEEKS